jgi:hypothetical protein
MEAGKMPIRTTRPPRGEGLKQYIIPLYTRPALKFLRGCEPWEDLADVIFGPPTSYPSREEIEKLKAVWFEFRDDILVAAAEYSPGKKPWGCRFDVRGEPGGKQSGLTS